MFENELKQYTYLIYGLHNEDNQRLRRLYLLTNKFESPSSNYQNFPNWG